MKKTLFANLDSNNFIDNRKFWQTMKPLFSNSGKGSRRITLAEKDEILSDDKTIAEKFNEYFVDAVSSLELKDKNVLIRPSKFDFWDRVTLPRVSFCCAFI